MHLHMIVLFLLLMQTTFLFWFLIIFSSIYDVSSYLHTTCMPPIAHSNLKAANILLDEDLMPHICDTGLAVLKPLTSNKIKIKVNFPSIIFFAFI